MADIVLSLVVSPILQEALSRVTSFFARLLMAGRDFEEDVTRLGDLLKYIESVAEDAEEKQECNERVRDWLQDLKGVAYHAVDVLDDCNYNLLQHEVETRSRKRKPFHIDSYLSGEIKKINDRFDMFQKRAIVLNLALRGKSYPISKPYLETDSFLDNSRVFGREGDVSNILSLLLNMKEKHPISGVSIVGMAGLGKTTVARLIYKEAKKELKEHYDLVAWVCVSEEFSDRTILVQLLEHFNNGVGSRNSINALLEDLAEVLEKKTFLLILDDVWNEDPFKWNSFCSRLSRILKKTGNSIIVTTRNKQVASVMETLPMKTYEMQRLSDDECWSIIKETVLRSSTATSIHSNLESIGQDIAKQCGGLPLVATVIGGTLSRQIETDKWLAIRNNNAWNLNSEDRNMILSILKISFDRLPSPLKKCFSYCSIFPKDFVIEKDDLVQLWMAQGFLYQSKESLMTMEEVGNQYFSDLLSNSLFLDVERDEYGNTLSCKMHDVVHDLALFVSKGETLIWELAGCKIDENANIRHLRVKRDNTERPNIPRGVVQRLHSLFVEEVDVFISMASDLRRLRALKIVGAKKEKLPTTLGKLKHLRYLNISKSKIKALPKSFSKLYNLQTFRLKMCSSDLKMPDDLSNLVSLRHICFDTEKHVPRGIGQVTSLQTLPIFSIGLDKGCGIEELGGLAQLRGELHIQKLNQVVSRSEAAKANLKGKTKLQKLKFEWSKLNTNVDNHEEVLEGCQPHLNLKSLSIVYGLNSSGASFTLNNLMELTLVNCKECMFIPSLGLFPNLKHLHIEGMASVRRMGHKFYTTSNGSQGGVLESIKLFPVLVKLTLIDMERLEEWVEVDEDDPTAGGKVEIVFPSLEELFISNCSKLKTFSMGGFSSNHKLSELKILWCPKLMAIPSTNGLSSLKSLELYEWPLEVPSALVSSISLQVLAIIGCPNIIFIPEDIGGLHYLTSLTIFNCKKLRNIPE